MQEHNLNTPLAVPSTLPPLAPAVATAATPGIVGPHPACPACGGGTW